MTRLRVAICDDDPIDLERAIRQIYEYDKNNILQIQSYTKASDLLLPSSANHFDIVLLDIEMEQPNGYVIGKQLVKTKEPPVIIFVTKSSAYTIKGYGIALRYLQKPLDQAALEEALDAAIQEATVHRLYFTSEDRDVALPLREILYIEMLGHYAVIHTNNSEYRFRSTLKEIQCKLPQGCFALPHKGILVNFEHVQVASKNEVKLDNGTVIPISRYRHRDFRDAFFRFLER